MSKSGAKGVEKVLNKRGCATKARRVDVAIMKPEYLAEIERMRLMDDDKAEEGRHAMCEAMEKIKAEGKRETMLATAKRLLANGKLMLKEIAQCTGLSLAQVKKLQASMA